MSPGTLAIASCIALVLLWIVVAPRRELRSPALSLLRCLFPAWRFYEAIGDRPALQHRVIGAVGEPGPWTATLPAPTRHPSMLLLNATGNLHLAQQSLVEQLVQALEDVAEGCDVEALVEYRLVQALVVQSLPPTAAREGCQFRVVGETTFTSRLFDPRELDWTSSPREARRDPRQPCEPVNGCAAAGVSGTRSMPRGGQRV